MHHADGHTADDSASLPWEELPVLWNPQSTAEGWLDALDGRVHDWLARRAATATVPEGATEDDRVQAAIRRACVHSALLGGATGAVSTLATAAVLSAGGTAAPLVAPLAAVTAGAEVVLRAGVHAELTASLAASVGLPLDATDASDRARLRTLLTPTDAVPCPDRALVIQMLDVGARQAVDHGGGLSRVKTPLRGMVPVLGIVTASVAAWRDTRKLGQSILGRLRRQRSLLDSLEDALEDCLSEGDLLVEGVWFLLTAGGPLAPEGAVVLARLLRDRDAVSRGALLRRFTDDERDWLDRLKGAHLTAVAGLRHGLESVARGLGNPAPVRRLMRRVDESLTAAVSCPAANTVCAA